MNEQINKAIEILRDGGVIIFPTDTALGIGCRIDNLAAVEKLFKIRKRSENKPVLVLVDSLEMAQNYLLPIPKKVKDKLIDVYWPGKLTIVLKCNTEKIPSLVRGGGNSLGVRFPNNAVLLQLIKGVEAPILAPSANISGEKTPFKFEDLDPELVKQTDYVLVGEINLEKKVSTVIDCTVEPWKVIRQGAVSIVSDNKI